VLVTVSVSVRVSVRVLESVSVLAQAGRGPREAEEISPDKPIPVPSPVCWAGLRRGQTLHLWRPLAPLSSSSRSPQAATEHGHEPAHGHGHGDEHASRSLF
jgi:hypothetical protein